MKVIAELDLIRCKSCMNENYKTREYVLYKGLSY